ncbi:MAG TPA: OsmC family protein [Thermomicrobiaceae bacterium]|nr:OsmC family protein [Thermomicrobiaceae bacterium]
MSQPVMTYHVEARTIARGTSVATLGESEIAFDTSSGRNVALPGPADLLTLAFAACVLKNVERFAGMLAFRYERAAIAVTAEREEPPPRISRIRYVLSIQTDEPAQRVDLLHRNIRKFGTIYNTLAAGADVDGEIVVELPAPLAAHREGTDR